MDARALGACCYRRSVITFRRDYDALTGMLTASTLVLSCANENSVKAANSMLEQRLSVLRPSCFRSFRHPSAPLTGVRPGRKLGSEEKSHIFLTSVVPAGRNVA